MDTGNTRWVDVNKCKEKEQKEQEYRDYKCSAGCCNYSINDTKWIDTGICNSTCNCVSLAPPEITSFAPLSYVDDTVCNWRIFNVTVTQAANVSWYLNDTLVLTNESVLEAKCTLHAKVAGEHNVSAIASNANGSDMQTWIWAVTVGLNRACGDICVNTTGWWRDGGTFYPSDTPIQAAIDNATAGETICVKDGTYNENVDVNTPLTIQSENGADSTIVNALDPNDHVFEVTADHVNIIGFTVQNASDNAGIYLYNLGYCTISDNTASNNAEGIFINPSNDCTLTNNIASNNGGRGIGLFNSSDCTLTNNIALNNYVGIKVRNSSNCMLDSNTASDNERGGIGLLSSSDCTVTSNTAFDNDVAGFVVRYSSNCMLNSNTAYNNYEGFRQGESSSCTYTSNTASNNEIGIGLWGSSNNTLTSNNVSNNILSDFRSADSHGNVVTDLTIASYPTTISFTYDDVGLKGVDTAPSDPEGKVNINKYVNVTGLTVNSWISLNVNYRDGDLGGVDADSLRMWRYDGGVWTEVSAPNGVNNVENYVYANITVFSIFAPLGNPSGVLKPDLIITEKWLCWPDNCTICYNVTNTGDGTAPAGHNTTLYVDGVAVAHDHVPVDLALGESYTGCFNGYVWTYTPPSDNITVCADNSETLDELDEDNNCLTNMWMCGDVNGDGKVTMSDVRKVFNRYLDSGYELNCCCKGEE